MTRSQQKEGDIIKKIKVLYPVLEKEIKERHIKKCDIAESLKIQPRTLTHKLNGRLKFSLEEAICIQGTWFSDIPIKELFKH